MKTQQAPKPRRPSGVPRDSPEVDPESPDPFAGASVAISGCDLRLTCPVCGGEGLVRTHGRLVDRLLNGFNPVRRFRCANPLCRFEGNFVLPSTLEELVRKIQTIDGCTRGEAERQVTKLAREFEAGGYGYASAERDNVDATPPRVLRRAQGRG